ncbi:MAG: diguanylate cyclase [Burkholderiaceae bacterium]
MLRRCIQIAAGVDVAFFFLFHALGSPLLAWVNVISVGLYGLAYLALKRRRNRIAIALIWTEVVCHASLGTIMVGWNSAFHYYLLIFVPAIFVSASTRAAARSVALLWLCYLAADHAMQSFAPLERLDPLGLLILRDFNISVVFGMLAYLSYYYIRLVAAAQAQLQKLATTDPLTGLYNRRHTIEVAEHEIRRRARSSAPLSFLIADIDHFKAINDTHGHDAGDRVLVEVAAALRRSTREQDIVARWGGEEFLVVLPDTDRDAAISVGERIRREMLQACLAGGATPVTLTIGVSGHQDGENFGESVGRADRALYRGKEAGRDRVQPASGEAPTTIAPIAGAA